MSELRISFRPEKYTLKDNFIISRGSKKSADIITVCLNDHYLSGMGECSPNIRYGQTISSELGKLEHIKQVLELSPKDFNRDKLNILFEPSPARSAVDLALWDLELKKKKQTIWSNRNIKEPDSLPTMITLDASTIKKNLTTASNYEDCEIFKIKFKGDHTDIDRLLKIRMRFPKKRLLIDANESIPPSKIYEYISYCEKYNIEVLEQPMKPEFDKLLGKIKTKIILCADESCSNYKDIKKIEKFYDAINIKLDKAGGLTEALRMQNYAISRRIKTLSGCMLCTSLGIAASQVVAARADYIDHDAPLFLERDREYKINYISGKMSIANSKLWG